MLGAACRTPRRRLARPTPTLPPPQDHGVFYVQPGPRQVRQGLDALRLVRWARGRAPLFMRGARAAMLQPVAADRRWSTTGAARTSRATRTHAPCPTSSCPSRPLQAHHQRFLLHRRAGLHGLVCESPRPRHPVDQCQPRNWLFTMMCPPCARGPAAVKHALAVRTRGSGRPQPVQRYTARGTLASHSLDLPPASPSPHPLPCREWGMAGPCPAPPGDKMDTCRRACCSGLLPKPAAAAVPPYAACMSFPSY